MCIAVYVPAEIEVSEAILRECYRNNPDGAGVMYTDGTKVYISKGFMTADKFVAAFQAIPMEFERSFHTRIATSGKVGEGCCHPFPIVENMKEMTKTKYVCDAAVAHNGIISWATPTKGRAEWYSDTMNFASQILWPLKESLTMPALQDLIERSTTGNKFIIMTPGKVTLIGTFTQEGGIYYSNTSFRVATKTVYYGCGDSSYGQWDAESRSYVRQGNKHTRKNAAITNMKDKSLTEAFWIIIETKDEGKLSILANALVLQGVNVIEEDEALIDGNSCYLFLVDTLPKESISSYTWKLMSQKVDDEVKI